MGVPSEFSRIIDSVAEGHKLSWLMRLVHRLAYYYLRLRNKPICFSLVGAEGTAVGEPLEVQHLRLYDMSEHAVCGALTGKVLLEGLRINAYQVVDYQPLNDDWAKSKIQPRWV